MAAKPKCRRPEMAVGMAVSCPAKLFGHSWAKREYGGAWKEATCAGVVESYQPKGTVTKKGVSKYDVWLLKFPSDDKPYPQKWDGLRKWLSEKDLKVLTMNSAKSSEV